MELAQIATIVTILVGICGLLALILNKFFNFGKIVGKIDSVVAKIDSVDAKINSVIDSVDAKINSVDAKIDLVDEGSKTRFAGLSARFDDMNKNIVIILDNLVKRPLVGSNSPIGLTEHGVEIGEKIGVDSFVERYQNFVIADESWSEYQIQQHCFDVVENKLPSKLSDDDTQLLEKVAYDKGISVSSLMRVIAIKMRDKKLKDIGRDVVNIDQHTPDT